VTPTGTPSHPRRLEPGQPLGALGG